MAKTRFCYDNLGLSATITASAEVANRPAAFLANHARWKTWRSSTTTGDQWVEFDFGSAQTIKEVALVNWRAHTGGSITAQYWGGAAWQTFGAFSLPAFNPTKVVAVWNTTGQSTAKIRIYFTNAGAANEYVELGVVVVGPYYQPTYTVIDGFQITPIDPSVIVQADGGQEETQARTIYHLIKGVFDTEPESDLDAFRTLFASVGYRVPFVLAIDPDDPDEMFYVRLTDLPLQHEYGDYWTLPISAQEVR